jgi:hypothetical protein
MNGRTATVGNNLKEGPIGQQEQDQRHKFRDHERKAWNQEG